MKKVISAVGDEFIVNNLDKAKFEVTGDIFEQEVVFDLLKNESFDYLIISVKIHGTHSKYSLIKHLRDINSKVKIIVISDEKNTEYEKYLESKNVYSVLIDGQFVFDDVLKALNKVHNNEIIKLDESKDEENNNSLMAISSNQEVVAFAGTEGAGKSTILVNLAVLLAEKSKVKVLIIDLDTLNGNINKFFEINSSPDVFNYELPEDKNASLNYLIDFIDKKTFNSEVLEKSAIKIKKYENLSVITGNTSLSVCKNVLSYEHYIKILEKAKELYDFIFIDTSSNIFLDSTQFALTRASKLIFVTEATNICVERTLRLFNNVYKAWGIDKKNIRILINKKTKYSIENTVINNIFTDYKVIGSIDYDDKYEKHLNIGRPYVIDNECSQYENILEEFNFIKKKNFKERLASGKLFSFTV